MGGDGADDQSASLQSTRHLLEDEALAHLVLVPADDDKRTVSHEPVPTGLPRGDLRSPGA
ncbi:hypothetical protein D3C73_683890 [compost metagenome]